MRRLLLPLMALAALLLAPAASAAMATPSVEALVEMAMNAPAAVQAMLGAPGPLGNESPATAGEPEPVGETLDRTVPQAMVCLPPVICTETRNNFEELDGEPNPESQEPAAEEAAPAENATPPAPAAEETASLDLPDVPFDSAPETYEEPIPDLPSTPARREPSPQPSASRAMEPVPARGGTELSWAVATAALALPGALLAKLAASLLAMLRRRDERPSLREAVLDAVARSPGVRHRELVRRIGRGNGTVEHHVRALIADGRVARVRHGGSTAYFLAGDLSAHEARLRLAVVGRTSRRLALDVAANSGSRLTDVARRVGVSLATAHYQAGKLVAAGILRDVEGAAGRRLEATPVGHACLAAVTAEGAAVASPFGAPLMPHSAPSPA